MKENYPKVAFQPQGNEGWGREGGDLLKAQICDFKNNSSIFLLLECEKLCALKESRICYPKIRLLAH